MFFFVSLFDTFRGSSLNPYFMSEERAKKFNNTVFYLLIMAYKIA